ncbi:unnamed protein product, partial [Bubo scandiacus]
MRRARCRALLGAEPARPGLPLPARRRPHGSAAGVTAPEKDRVPAARTARPGPARPGGSRAPPPQPAGPSLSQHSAQLKPEEEGEAQPDQ